MSRGLELGVLGLRLWRGVRCPGRKLQGADDVCSWLGALSLGIGDSLAGDRGATMSRAALHGMDCG